MSAKRRTYRYEVEFRRSILGYDSMLDMLRYDGARVLGQLPAKSDNAVRLRLEAEHPPATARWASFGITTMEEEE